MNRIINWLNRIGNILMVNCFFAVKLEGALVVLAVVLKTKCPKALIYSLLFFAAFTVLGVFMQILARVLRKLKRLAPIAVSLMTHI